MIWLNWSKGTGMSNYCLFTIEHSEASRIYVRGVADITSPIDDFDKIVWFRNGSDLQHSLPTNPYREGEKDYDLYNDLLKCIKHNFEDICHELIFAITNDEKTHEWENTYNIDNLHVDFEKVII